MSPTPPRPTNSQAEYDALRDQPIEAIREAIRSGAYRGQTAGFGKGLLQANLAILPYDLAIDFHAFCQRNPQPCPIVGLTRPGDPRMPELGDIDIRTDIPSYNVYRYSELDAQVHDITDLWQDDFVAFALGCSFTFERALQEAGIDLRHITENRTVSMYKTNIELERAGPFGGGMVVSMRPVREDLVETAFAICRNYVHAHGEPVHVGDPAAIGIADLDAPDWGDKTTFEPGEVPVFWACGVTPQNALSEARPTICITHTPGRMLVTDHPEDVPPKVLGLEPPPAVAAAE